MIVISLTCTDPVIINIRMFKSNTNYYFILSKWETIIVLYFANDEIILNIDIDTTSKSAQGETDTIE